jgi:ribosomal protein S18 acetylase RimI-like enzyme
LGGWLGQKIIATISAVSYGGRFGFIGFYIVDPEFRGQGYGRKIWDAALERHRGQCLGLDGVVA